jgi:hypothetical protein
MKRKHPEDEIQRAVFKHFEARAALGVFAFHPANGGWRSSIEAKILKGLGVKAGVPDVIAIKDGKVYALELKVPGRRATDVQVETIDRMTKAGARCAIAHGLDDALRWLEGEGLLRGRMT